MWQLSIPSFRLERLSRAYIHFKPVEESEYLKTAKVVRIVDAEHVKLDNWIAGFKSWHSDALDIQSQDDEYFECCGQCENCSKNELCAGIDE